MRPIKFRAWDNEDKKMIPNEKYFLSLDEDGDFIVCLKQHGYGMSGELKFQPRITVMQFTGLHDKNGREIYEGDIVKMSNVITGSVGLNPGFSFGEDDKLEIAWDNEISAWSVAGELNREDRVEVSYRNQVIQLIQYGYCEVIGNIHESPELLNQ